jgi:uncharacterized protein YkvS
MSTRSSSLAAFLAWTPFDALHQWFSCNPFTIKAWSQTCVVCVFLWNKSHRLEKQRSIASYHITLISTASYYKHALYYFFWKGIACLKMDWNTITHASKYLILRFKPGTKGILRQINDKNVIGYEALHVERNWDADRITE